MKCLGYTKSGQACRRLVGPSGYCYHHMNKNHYKRLKVSRLPRYKDLFILAK